MSDSAYPDVAHRPKVLYVMGAGRSGSTILGVALGNCDGVFYAGELDKWLLRSGEPKLSDTRRVEFWDGVRERVAAPAMLFGSQAHRYLERSSALFNLNARSIRRRIREPYRRAMGRLYSAIAADAGVTHVVDSSHYPLRARELQSLDGIDLYLIFLIRDTRQVISSFARDDVAEPRFGAGKTRAYLLLTHLLSTWVFLKHPPERRLLLSHEDFLEDPQGVLRCVLDHVGSSAAVPDLEVLSTGIPLQGNRLIHQDVVSLQRREASGERRLLRQVLDLPRIALLARLRPRATARRVERSRSTDAAAPVAR